ncbi:polysaccharide lyase family 7 protein [Shewanella ulleungensis]|uniref:polysaccharide lyase family 7 protein n=1 Tax=Shewanella ulleungensis TaxID=2282699 RepID=UPI003D793D41
MRRLTYGKLTSISIIGLTLLPLANAADLENELAQYKSQLSATLSQQKAPSQNFDLTKWKINLPVPDHRPSRLGGVMEINATQLNDVARPFTDYFWFYTDPLTGAMVMKSPNTAPTTANSKNARSELRAMLSSNDNVTPSDPSNNFVIAANPQRAKYGAIGGQLSATVAVDWVSTSGDDSKFPAHSVVVGQIHGAKTEPLKIYYRKLPAHDTGSLFWNYEVTPKDVSQRYDVPHLIWGETNLTAKDLAPKDGIKLGELFSYDIHVEQNIMTLTFIKHPGTRFSQTKTFTTDLSKGLPGHPKDVGFANDTMYFKAGAYNQCNQGKEHPIWGTACNNDGVEAGDYTQVSFYRLSLKQ